MSCRYDAQLVKAGDTTKFYATSIDPVAAAAVSKYESPYENSFAAAATNYASAASLAAPPGVGVPAITDSSRNPSPPVPPPPASSSSSASVKSVKAEVGISGNVALKLKMKEVFIPNFATSSDNIKPRFSLQQ